MTTVLVIDDHPIVLKGCRRLLEDAGIDTVLEARKLVSGYRLYYRHHPDVVVLDLKMRGQELGVFAGTAHWCASAGAAIRCLEVCKLHG